MTDLPSYGCHCDHVELKLLISETHMVQPNSLLCFHWMRTDSAKDQKNLTEGPWIGWWGIWTALLPKPEATTVAF